MSYRKLIKVKPLNSYKLHLEFSTGEKKMFDVSPYISGSWFGKLKDVDYFKKIRIADNTVEWSDGQDIAPHELYDDSIPVSGYQPEYKKH